MLIIAPSSPQPETPAASELAAAICVSAREALAPSSYRKLEWAVQAGLERRFGAALADARRFAEESVELACIQRELSRHIVDCALCCGPVVVCTEAGEMERREDRLTSRLAGGF